MRLLLIHADSIEYRVKRKTKVAESIGDAAKSGRLEDALAAFIAVEDADDADEDYVVSGAVKAIAGDAEQLQTRKVMLYPYAHLSSSLGSPESAVRILDSVGDELDGQGFEVIRAPFGWYKAFTLSCKGHPLSELSRSIVPPGAADSGAPAGRARPAAAAGKVDESKALAAEDTAKSELFVLDNGKITPAEDYDYSSKPRLDAFYRYEESRARAVDRTPPHVELMRRLELVDYEPGSDAGNLRWYPKGRMVKGLLEEYVLDSSRRVNAMEVETPVMYDREHPALRSYLDRFPARQYGIDSDKKHLFLRFAACFGQFLMNHDMTISYRNLPLRMVEMTRYSFRREQSGELVGLRRLRSFTMPDMHTLCEDMEQATEEFAEQFRMCMNVLDDIGLPVEDYEVAIRYTREFAEGHPDLVNELAKIAGKPVLLEVWEERFFYFVLKFEFNFIDNLYKASALSTVQIDVENAERYDISYATADGTNERPIILHCSPSGAIERCLYALLEQQHRRAETGGVPMLPVWLSPTQVRIVPVGKEHIEHALKVADRLAPLRVDVDDREQSVSRQIRDAGVEWVPYVAVIGNKEVADGTLQVTVRSKSKTLQEKLNARAVAG